MLHLLGGGREGSANIVVRPLPAVLLPSEKNVENDIRDRDEVVYDPIFSLGRELGVIELQVRLDQRREKGVAVLDQHPDIRENELDFDYLCFGILKSEVEIS
jgi:hypoxanthine-guanine phosphoribosyltransferase